MASMHNAEEKGQKVGLKSLLDYITNIMYLKKRWTYIFSTPYITSTNRHHVY